MCGCASKGKPKKSTTLLMMEIPSKETSITLFQIYLTSTMTTGAILCQPLQRYELRVMLGDEFILERGREWKFGKVSLWILYKWFLFPLSRQQKQGRKEKKTNHFQSILSLKHLHFHSRLTQWVLWVKSTRSIWFLGLPSVRPGGLTTLPSHLTLTRTRFTQTTCTLMVQSYARRDSPSPNQSLVMTVSWRWGFSFSKMNMQRLIK